MVNDPKQAVTLFRQAVSDPLVIASLGPNNSVGYVPVVPVSEQLEMPLISNGSGAIIKQWSPFAYRVNPVASIASPRMLQKVVGIEKVKRLAIIYDQSHDMQVSDAMFCRNLQKDLGYELVADETLRSGDRFLGSARQDRGFEARCRLDCLAAKRGAEHRPPDPQRRYR
ncbi:type 1 periplasmic-binding domain-containing protein [Microvirga alba]|uniref:Leucine-binding protein domain-containing protein n=1 Tax=Microvirga alba TaxID=2791025 RepID=A0A931BVY5_9HYPH|nr:hypothetical protein [Microvirga alba]MBF9235728.1 hypothetical protein [Microvirga alba]